MEEKFHKNLCSANISASQLKAIGTTLGLIQDDLPGDQAMAMGDLIVKLSREILEATTGMEEAMMELERRLPKVRTVRVRTVGDPADKKPIKVRVEKIEKNDRT